MVSYFLRYFFIDFHRTNFSNSAGKKKHANLEGRPSELISFEAVPPRETEEWLDPDIHTEGPKAGVLSKQEISPRKYDPGAGKKREPHFSNTQSLCPSVPSPLPSVAPGFATLTRHHARPSYGTSYGERERASPALHPISSFVCFHPRTAEPR